MLNKKVKEYSGRQRIDINKKDGLEDGQEVVILTSAENDGINKNIHNLTQQLRDTENKLYATQKELNLIQKQDKNLKEIIEDTTAPIKEFYENELKTKDDKIERLENQYTALLFTVSQYNLELMSFNWIDKLTGKDKKYIKLFNENIKLLDNDNIVEADGSAVPGADGSSDKDGQEG